jgi:hypothetical protein
MATRGCWILVEMAIQSQSTNRCIDHHSKNQESAFEVNWPSRKTCVLKSIQHSPGRSPGYCRCRGAPLEPVMSTGTGRRRTQQRRRAQGGGGRGGVDGQGEPGRRQTQRRRLARGGGWRAASTGRGKWRTRVVEGQGHWTGGDEGYGEAADARRRRAEEGGGDGIWAAAGRGTQQRPDIWRSASIS